MSEWTDGKWEVKHEIMVMAGNRAVASCGGYSQNFDHGKVRRENIANARLVAAAPQLYEALRDMVAIAQHENWQYQTDTGRNILLEQAEAALDAAKVTE